VATVPWTPGSVLVCHHAKQFRTVLTTSSAGSAPGGSSGKPATEWARVGPGSASPRAPTRTLESDHREVRGEIHSESHVVDGFLGSQGLLPLHGPQPQARDQFEHDVAEDRLGRRRPAMGDVAHDRLPVRDDDLTASRPSISGVAASTRHGAPSTPNTSSPTLSPPMVRPTRWRGDRRVHRQGLGPGRVDPQSQRAYGGGCGRSDSGGSVVTMRAGRARIGSRALVAAGAVARSGRS
jgi:hypothetical protein